MEEVAQEIQNLLGTPPEEILAVSAKEGTNVEKVLEAVIERVPPPQGETSLPLRALVFDSHYDPYKGVVAYIRVFDGVLRPEDMLRVMSSGIDFRPVEIGVFAPDMRPVNMLSAGEVVMWRLV